MASSNVNPRAPRVLLSGGGTGGHIYPALAIADAVRELHPDAECLFIGALGKMEMERVPRAGYRIEGVPVVGFQRGLDRRNLAFPFKLGAGLSRAYKIVKRFDPDVAIGTGGFASGPALAVAAMQARPVFVQEQNAFPGVTNRLLARAAKRVFTAYEASHGFFPQGKCFLTGNPLRSTLQPGSLGEAAAARVFFGLDPAKPTLLSFGGSLGARTMNEANASMEAFWRERPKLQLIWQTGRGYFERFSESGTARLPNVSCVPYLERMDLAYGAADLVACRAGALSVSELELLGKPALLIPSPNVTGDHQTANARAVEAAGGAVLIHDSAQINDLPIQVARLLDNETLRSEMARAIRALATPDAARTIAENLIAHVR